MSNVNESNGKTSWHARILEAPREAADKNTESVRAKSKTAVSSVINSAKELGARARDYARSDEAKELADRALGKVKQASSSAKEHATDLTRRARDAAVATMPFWKRLFREIREIVGATARQTGRLIGYGYGIARTRVLLRKARGAQLALGNRMYEAGVGDEAIRGQIASLDDRIASVELGKGSTKQMEAEKKGLMIRLAADALAQDVAPTGAAAEHGGAISARDAVEAHRSHMESTRAGLAPQDTTTWRRIGLGYGVVMLALTFATTLFLRSANMPTDSNDTSDTHAQRIERRVPPEAEATKLAILAAESSKQAKAEATKLVFQAEMAKQAEAPDVQPVVTTVSTPTPASIPTTPPLPPEYRVVAKNLGMDMKSSAEQFRDDQPLSQDLAEAHSSILELRSVKSSDQQISYIADEGQKAISEAVSHLKNGNPTASQASGHWDPISSVIRPWSRRGRLRRLFARS